MNIGKLNSMKNEMNGLHTDIENTGTESFPFEDRIFFLHRTWIPKKEWFCFYSQEKYSRDITWL